MSAEIRALNNTILSGVTDRHVAVCQQVHRFMNDVAEDGIAYLDFDDPDGPFQLMFHDSNLSMEFDDNSINVLEFDLDDNDGTEYTRASFHKDQINRATHWLLTQAKQARQSS